MSDLRAQIQTEVGRAFNAATRDMAATGGSVPYYCYYTVGPHVVFAPEPPAYWYELASPEPVRLFDTRPKAVARYSEALWGLPCLPVDDSVEVTVCTDADAEAVTLGEFREANAEDADTLAAVAWAVAQCKVAVLGGGAAPLVLVYHPGTVNPDALAQAQAGASRVWGEPPPAVSVRLTED